MIDIYVDPDAHARRMTAAEQEAYEAGHQDAAAGKEMACCVGGRRTDRQQRLAYERGYRNHAGESVDA
jgi:hypothetical protein